MTKDLSDTIMDKAGADINARADMYHEADIAVAKAHDMPPVTTDEEYEFAAESIRALREMNKKVDALMGDSLKAANATVKAIRDVKRKLTEPIAVAEKIIKGRMAEYALLKQKKQEELAAKVEDPALSEAVRQVDAKPAADGVSLRTRWTWSLIDERKVKKAYMKIDNGKIQAAVRKLEKLAEKEVGGIEVVQVTDVAVRMP